MQAAVEIKGKQYIVQVGSRLRVDKIDSEDNSVLKADKVLMFDNDGKVQLNPKKIEVSFTVLNQSQGKKIRVFKHHAKKRYRRTQGHRQDYTEVEIKTIAEVK
jgi:large subunit ribosomal protein L21